METKTPAVKMGLHPGMRAYFMQAPADVLPALHLPPLEVPGRLEGTFDYIHFFIRRQEEIPAHLPLLKLHLREDGAIWMSWPKAGQLGTDLRLPDVIRLGYDQGLVESKSISLTPVWSALKFTWPKKGKVYNNSYGNSERASTAPEHPPFLRSLSYHCGTNHHDEIRLPHIQD